jgi:hypothetical protein
MLYTFQDAVLDALDFQGQSAGSGSDQKPTRFARRAVDDALRDLANAHSWAYYEQGYQFTTVGTYATGTVTYDHTGGTYERQLTLASGTWPSWANLGSILVGNISYRVSTRVSDSVVTLSPNSNPGDDLAAGTAYTLLRDTYPCPSDMVSAGDLYDLTSQQLVPNITPDAMQRRKLAYVGAGQPFFVTLIGDDNYQGSMAFKFNQAPDSAREFGFVYRRRPRDLNIPGYATGTACTTVDSTTVCGTGTVWSDAMVGSVIRFSDSSTAPTGLIGTNPAALERVVASVTDATHLELDAAADRTLSGGIAYAISDPIDIDVGPMLNAFRAGLRKSAAPAADKKNSDDAESRWRRDLRLAIEADSKFRGQNSRWMPGWYTLQNITTD